jgi:hypothetical protein
VVRPPIRRIRAFRFSKILLGMDFSGLYDYDGFRESREEGPHVDRLCPGLHRRHRHDDPAGRFFFHNMASLAQMERELLAERTRAGLAAARRRARVGGRKRRMTPGGGGIGPEALEAWNGSPRRRSESRRLQPDAVPLGTRHESMSLERGCEFGSVALET